jgi:drug/metabolite transporter (DMT)-like permease
MPIANATAVFQATPLVMTACAAVFLGEKVGPARWVAIAIGLCGVMVIVRPGLEGFDVWSLAILAAVASVALRDISTARISAHTPTSLVTFATAITVTGLGLAMMPFEAYIGRHVEWTWPTDFEAAMVVLNALSLLGGYVGMLVATRLAETSAIAPFRYALLVWAFIFGVVVFGQYPDLPTLVGAAIVVVTGLYSFHRERSTRSAPDA